MAERIAADQLRRRLGRTAARFALASAGTGALAGQRMDAYSVQALAELGIEEGPFEARQLASEPIEMADLVLCASREHVAAVLSDRPRALHRTFTLREFHRATVGVRPREIARDDVGGSMLALVALAASRRGWTATGSLRDEDLADPYGRSLSAFRECGRIISETLAEPISLLSEAVRFNCGPRHADEAVSEISPRMGSAAAMFLTRDGG